MKILRTPDGRFDGLKDYPFAPHYVEVEGLRLHYVDEGPRDADPILMLHGEPSWSYLYRKMIPLCAVNHRVIAPDLVGFGKSDKPVSVHDYSYQAHVDWITGFVRALDLRRVTLVAQDWGSLIGLRVAAENEDRFARIVIGNGMLPTGDQRVPGAFRLWRAFSRWSPLFPISRIVASGVLRDLEPEERRAYDAPFPSSAYKAGARALPGLVPSSPEDPAAPACRKAWEVLARWDKPFLTTFSRNDPITRGGDRYLQERIPGARGLGHRTLGGGHFLQEDSGPEFAAAVLELIASPGAGPGARTVPDGPSRVELVPLRDPPLELRVTRAMTTPEMFTRALPRAVYKSQGRLKGPRPLPSFRVTQTGLHLDSARIEAYRLACSYRAEAGRVPLPYPEVYFSPLMAEAIVSARFPLSPLGLIHTRQRVRAHEVLLPGERVDATAAMSELRRTPKGYEVDFSMTLERRGALVWSGVATLLSRSARVRGNRDDARAHRAPPDLTRRSYTRVLDVPECTGRDYARASGDWNPHHLWTLTARPLGYRQPIAHGMWTFARALTYALAELPDGVAVEAVADFKKPLLLPGRMRLDVAPLGAGSGPVHLQVRDPDSGAPYLLGECAISGGLR